MGETTTSTRISAETNRRMREALEKSRLSRDQFVDFLINEALDQVDQEEVSYEPLRIVLTLRREHGKSTGETLASRMSAWSAALSKQVENPKYRSAEESAIPDNENPETLLAELVQKLQQNPRVVGALATLLDITRP